MLKETVTYTDFDDKPCTDTLYFNLTKTDMVDLIDLLPQLEAWQTKTSGDPRELTMDEIREMLDIVKRLVAASYGVRSEDGKHFRKSPEIFADFKSTAAYDAFMFGMFEDITKALRFMVGIVPRDMVDADVLNEALQYAQPPTVTGVDEVPLPAQVEDISATDAEVPAWLREDREPTQAEFARMNKDEMMLAFKKKNERSAAQ